MSATKNEIVYNPIQRSWRFARRLIRKRSKSKSTKGPKSFIPIWPIEEILSITGEWPWLSAVILVGVFSFFWGWGRGGEGGQAWRVEEFWESIYIKHSWVIASRQGHDGSSYAGTLIARGFGNESKNKDAFTQLMNYQSLGYKATRCVIRVSLEKAWLTDIRTDRQTPSKRWDDASKNPLSPVFRDGRNPLQQNDQQTNHFKIYHPKTHQKTHISTDQVNII